MPASAPRRVDLAGEGLDYAIRFGDGFWHGTEATPLLAAPLSPVAAPEVAVRLRNPIDLAHEQLLRSYRADEWTRWFAVAALDLPAPRGTIFDSSIAMADAAAQALGVALVPVAMFERDLALGRLVRPFTFEITVGSYWLTALKSRRVTAAMQTFRAWLLANLPV